jgi:hypothetical protein
VVSFEDRSQQLGQSTDVQWTVLSGLPVWSKIVSAFTAMASCQIALAVSEGSSPHASSPPSLQGNDTALLARRVLAPKFAANARFSQHSILWIQVGISDRSLLTQYMHYLRIGSKPVPNRAAARRQKLDPVISYTMVV